MHADALILFCHSDGSIGEKSVSAVRFTASGGQISFGRGSIYIKNRRENMSKMITIGETMAEFVSPQPGYLRYMKNYELHAAGAETNVAIGVCKLGHSASWISRLGKDELGIFIQNSVRAEGVDTTYLKRDPEHNTGVMFKQVLTGRETSMFYYRENSAAANMTPDDLKPEMFEGADVLHLSGITPVLSESCEAMIERAVELAKCAGLKLSFDPNIRRKLWKDRDYTPVIKKLCDESNILMLGVKEAEVLYGTTDKGQIADLFFANSEAKYLAIKDGGNGAFVADRNGRYAIPPYPCKPVDPTGAGDAFNAGFLCGLMEGRSIEVAGKIAAIAGAKATESYGDMEGYPTYEDMQDILSGGDTEIYR